MLYQYFKDKIQKIYFLDFYLKYPKTPINTILLTSYKIIIL